MVSNAGAGICCEAASTPSAIGRSKRPPSFGRSAGARLIVIQAGIDNRAADAMPAFFDLRLREGAIYSSNNSRCNTRSHCRFY
ncbi:MAG: hypothetical protein ACRD98_05750, partial [Nitrososphaera sp.]